MQLTLQSIPLTETRATRWGQRLPTRCRTRLPLRPRRPVRRFCGLPTPLYLPCPPTQPRLEGLLSGEDIRRHLQGCERCVLFGATAWGRRPTPSSARAQVDDMAKALWLDAAASAAIEEVCDEAQRQIALELECALTARFSCGYGDLPLGHPAAVSVAAGRRAQNRLSPVPPACSPRSSRSAAVIGILPPGADAPKARPACAICPLTKTCPLKRKGVFCGIHSD